MVLKTAHERCRGTRSPHMLPTTYSAIAKFVSRNKFTKL